MSNESQHESVSNMLHIMWNIYRVHHGQILIKFSDNHVGMVLHTRIFSGKDLKSNDLH